MPPGETRSDAVVEAGTVVVWRLGDAFLAVALEHVVEVTAVENGAARGRGGAVDLIVPTGLPDPERPTRAVVLQADDRRLAVPADEVYGTRACDPAGVTAVPDWLAALPEAFRSLVRVDDGRLAALLDPLRLTGRG